MLIEVIATAVEASNAEHFHFTSQHGVTFWHNVATATAYKFNQWLKTVITADNMEMTEFVPGSLLWARCLLLWMHFKRGQSFYGYIRVFFFQPNQTALVREQHLSLRLHEWLHGTVLADHRLMLQRGDSSWHTDPRGRTKVAPVKDGLWSTHTNMQFVPCLVVPLLVNNDSRTAPSSCQSLSAWVGRQRRRKTETEFHAHLLLSYSSDEEKKNTKWRKQPSRRCPF